MLVPLLFHAIERSQVRPVDAVHLALRTDDPASHG
jgi:hypothetical protein